MLCYLINRQPLTTTITIITSDIGINEIDMTTKLH